jgi:hypothetical protein
MPTQAESKSRFIRFAAQTPVAVSACYFGIARFHSKHFAQMKGIPAIARPHSTRKINN